jgi:hypothetical protein
MSSFSIDAVWDDMIVFLRRESGIVLPLALATFGVAMIMLGFSARPMETMSAGTARPGLQILWTIPAMLLTVLGNMAISLLVLRAGITVGESLRTAIARLPVVIGIALLIGLAACILGIVAIVFVTLLGTILAADPATKQNLAMLLIMLPAGWIGIRLFLMWQLVADGAKGPIASLRGSFALTRGQALRSFMVIMIFGAVYISLITISQLALTPVVRLLGIATGQVEMMKLVAELITALIGSVLMMGWTVYLAFAYRRMSA